MNGIPPPPPGLPPAVPVAPLPMLSDKHRRMNPRGSAESVYLGGKGDPRWNVANKAYNQGNSGTDAVLKTSFEDECASVRTVSPTHAELKHGILQLKLHPNAKTSGEITSMSNNVLGDLAPGVKGFDSRLDATIDQLKRQKKSIAAKAYADNGFGPTFFMPSDPAGKPGGCVATAALSRFLACARSHARSKAIKTIRGGLRAEDRAAAKEVPPPPPPPPPPLAQALPTFSFAPVLLKPPVGEHNPSVATLCDAMGSMITKLDSPALGPEARVSVLLDELKSFLGSVQQQVRARTLLPPLIDLTYSAPVPCSACKAIPIPPIPIPPAELPPLISPLQEVGSQLSERCGDNDKVTVATVELLALEHVSDPRPHKPHYLYLLAAL